MALPALCLATDPIDPDVMRRRPRARNEAITNRAFFTRLILAGFATGGASFAVFLYSLGNAPLEIARTYAFTVIVFAELLKSFSFRSETTPVWRIPLLANVNLALVVAISLGLQFWSHRSEVFAAFLKTSLLPFRDCAMLLAVSALPLFVLEIAKVLRNKSR